MKMQISKSLKAVYEKFKITKDNVDQVVDGIGMPIDEHIKGIVVWFNEHRFETKASCEGHQDHGLPYPWLDFDAQGRHLKHQLIGFYRDRKPLLFIEENASRDRLRPIDELSAQEGREEINRFMEWMDNYKKLPVHLMTEHLQTECGLVGEDARWSGYATSIFEEITCQKCLLKINSETVS